MLILFIQYFNCTLCSLIVLSAQILTMGYGVSFPPICLRKDWGSQLICSDERMHLAPTAPIGVMHDWYPTNKSQYNDMQSLNTKKARVDIPFLQTGECLHGVGSFKQSLFPQSIVMSASFDTSLVHRVGRAIAEEATSIGIHACFAPVLDLGKDPRWGRAQGKNPLLETGTRNVLLTG
jgi:beta-glucosidase-like glycosyl hydrolase